MRFLFTSLALLLVVGIPDESFGKARFSASFGVVSQYSDNVNQSFENTNNSVITDFTPKIGITDQGAKTEYALQASRKFTEYRDDSRKDRQQDSASLSISRYEFKKTLRLYANSGITNVDQNLDTFFDDLGGDDRLETIFHSVGASFDSKRRNYYDVKSEINYRLVETEDDLVDSDVISGSLFLGNGSRQTRSYWNIITTHTTEESDSTQDQTISDALIGFQFSQNLSVFGQANREELTADNREDILNETWGLGIRITRPNLSASLALNRTEKGDNQDFFSAGFNWEPSSRTQLDFSLGRRFFGETISGSLAHRTRRLEQSLNYADQVTSFSQTVGSIGTLFCEQDDSGAILLDSCILGTDLTAGLNPDLIPVTQVLVEDVTKGQTLNRTASYNITYRLPKTSLYANLLWNRSKSLNESLGSQDYNVQKSAQLGLTWNFSRKTQVLLQAKVEKTEDRESTVDPVDLQPSITFNTKLNQKVTLSFTYTYAERKSDVREEEFEENRIGLSINARL